MGRVIRLAMMSNAELLLDQLVIKKTIWKVADLALC
jgi:hypothetical protein